MGELNAMDMVGVGIVCQSQERNQHASIPLRDHGAVVKRRPRGSGGFWLPKLYWVLEPRIVADSNAGGPTVILPRLNKVYFIVRNRTVVCAVERAGAVPGDSSLTTLF